MTDLSPEAQELLQQARTAFSPSEDRLLAVRSSLKAELGASMNAPPSSASSSASTAGGVGARVFGAAGWSTGHSVLAAVAIGAIGAGAVAMWPLTPRSSGPAAVPSELVGQPQPGIAAASAAEQETPSELATPNPSPAPQEQAPPDTALERGTPPALRGARARARSDAPREALPMPPAAVAPRAEATDSLAEEVRMLREARAALDRGDAAEALRLLDAHATRFRRGTLHEERLATRVQALCALGLVDRARLAAQELERVAPRSPHLARVRASCIAGPANR